MRIRITEQEFRKVNSAEPEGYSDLQKTLKRIDAKYSAAFQDPGLKLPETLGLGKRTYEKQSEETLRKQAAEQLKNVYDRARNDLQTENASAVRKVRDSAQKAREDEASVRELLPQQLEKTKETLKNAAIRKGTARSSILEQASEEEEAQAAKTLRDAKEKTLATLRSLAEEEAALQTRFGKEEDLLEEKYAQQVEDRLQKLRKEEESKEAEVLKFNNAVDEKEAKYQKSREEAMLNARYKEWDRINGVSSLLAQLGEEGLKRRVEEEKAEAVQTYLARFTPRQALDLFLNDDSMKETLGGAYDAVYRYLQRRNG